MKFPIRRKTSYTPSEADIDKMKKDTVIELKIRGKEHVEVVKQNGDDNPPFNFQVILNYLIFYSI